MCVIGYVTVALLLASSAILETDVADTIGVCLVVLAFLGFVVCILGIAIILMSKYGYSMLLGRVDHGLPPGVKTFGDLARLIAGDQAGFCEKCGYNLTGNVSGRCSECGTERTGYIEVEARGSTGG
jgi:hypothetical protein